MSDNDKKMVEDFIVNKKSHEEQLTLDFAKAIIDCEIQKKEITEDVKEIKKEAKDNGIQVQYVMKAVKALKAYIKTEDLEKREVDSLYDMLADDADIKFKLETLVSN